MKVMVFTVILVLASTWRCTAQEKLTAARKYEIRDNASCDNMGWYADEFALAMLGEPAKKGLIVIKPDERSVETAIRLSHQIHRAVAYGRFADNRPAIKFLPPDSRPTTTLLFMLSEDMPLPNMPLTDQPIITKLNREFFYNATFSEACETIRIDEFIRFLTANSPLRTKIFVYDDSRLRRRRTANRWIRLVTKKSGIEARRIRIFLRAEDHSSGWSTPYSSFWIVP